ncbi:MAG TPA: FkbM family methyltransferase [Cyclobacteriaceae bacterium]|nr:FkbM family methyltransferase [Cyclobacteriaceae bacterium]
MTESSLGRYWNLFRFIRNWPLYFSHKQSKTFTPARFITRGTALTFDVPTFELYLVFKEIFLTDFYSIDDWINTLPQTPVVVDVGGNAGYFSMLLLSKKPNTSVYAYEAIEENYKLYRNNIEINPVAGKARVFHRAVTGRPVESITLYKESNSDNSVTASVYQDFESQNLKAVTVKAISLEQILSDNNLDHVDLLKLDCEGSEYPIVYESSPEIWKKIKAIFLEVHNLDEDQRNEKSLNHFLHAAGYHTTQRLAGNGCYAVYATRQ